MTRLLLTSALLLGTAASAFAALLTPEGEAWEAVLERRLSAPDPATGLIRFDYAGLTTSDRAALDAYVAALAAMEEPEDDSEASAYWANLYNAVTVQTVADSYPVESIKDIGGGLFSSGPWKSDRVTVRGEALSLDDIEHGILRKRYPSPLVHYTVNCASVGCPNLLPKLWRGETLDADREAAARAFVNSPRGVTIRDGKATVSSIYSWFQSDFGGSRASVVDHLRDYADPELAEQLEGIRKYSKHDYDWSLNGQ